MSAREFDIVLVGATGFVGRLTAAHLARRVGEGASVRVALAGRNRERLESAHAELPGEAADWPLVVVDVTDEAQVAELAARTTVVCTTVGPYQEYGQALARACAEAGTHYCDLTGEVTFVRWSLDTLAETAEQSGGRIVHSCGFDSIPSDLGVLVTARAAADAGDGLLTTTTTRVRSMRGGLSGGTLASMRGQIVGATQDPAVRKLLADPYALSPDRDAEPHAARSRRGPLEKVVKSIGVGHDAGTRRWTAPFVMASYNTRIVRWTNAATDWSYGRDFRYSEVVDTGSGPLGAARAGLMGAAVNGAVAGLSLPPTRALLDRVLPEPGEGPSEKSMKNGRFVYDIEAATTTGARYRTRVADDRDPGYTSTAVMLGESALALAAGEGAADRGGVLSPAAALGEPLVERLRAQGFTFETVGL